jgi:molybdopterin molybdotransferase
VLITTGGVSMGEYDLVGGVLEALGVELVLHKVAVKPGKPIWFGMRGAVPVFGLPGNPVSSVVGLELFCGPALERLSGVVDEANGGAPRVWHGAWEGAPTRAIEREQYVPVRAEPRADGGIALVPVRWRGSADVVGLAQADGWAVVPAGEVAEPGQLVRYHPFTVR